MSEPSLSDVARVHGLDLDDPRQRAFAESLAAPVLLGEQLLVELTAAGVIQGGEKIRRVVIDAEVGRPVMFHVERFGDSRMLQVLRTLKGVQVREVERPRREIDVTAAEDVRRRTIVGEERAELTPEQVRAAAKDLSQR